MSECPICKTEYSTGVNNSCNTCGWNLTPSLPTLGDIPELELVKERAKLEWAKEQWTSHQVQEQEKQALQRQIEEQQEQMRIQQQTIDRQQIDRLEYENLLQQTSNTERLAELENLQKGLEEREQMARTIVSRLSGVAIQIFSKELGSISNRQQAISQIRELSSQKLKSEWEHYPHRLNFMENVLEILEFTNEKWHVRLDEIWEQLSTGEDLFSAADALLSIRAEMIWKNITISATDSSTHYRV